MTPAELRILETLAERFSRSAQADGGAALRLTPEKSFADLLSSGPDVYESFLEAAERFESEGIVTLAWKRFRKGEELASIVLRDSEAIFSLLGRPVPSDEAARARETARRITDGLAERGDATSDAARAFFSWLADNVRARDASAGDRAIDLARAIADFASLVDALRRHAKGGLLSGITPRALSIKLFSDSKRIESLLAELAPLLTRARRAGIPVPDTSPVERSFPETLVAGVLAFELGETSAGDSTRARIDNPAGCVIGLPLVTAMRIERIVPTVQKSPGAHACLVAVENLETFYALATRGESTSPREDAPLAEAFLYVGGHPNRAVQRLLDRFARSGFKITHAGDLDPEGILILQEVMDAAGAKVEPLRMDARTFDAYRDHSRELEKTALARVALIRDDTRALPGIESLLERILSTGRGVEQEIVEY